ncbi:Hypothetical protein D9617_14g077920 [Elsinoe fawcettii]|nr:Hypothetical protein D9617_14g077920 [Elsinoe fawcettii]
MASGYSAKSLDTYLTSSTTNLRYLHWEWDYISAFEHPANGPVIDLSNVFASLELIRHSLRELVVEASCPLHDGNLAQSWLEIRGSPTNLIDIDLDRLDVPLTLLVGFRPKDRKRLQDVIPRGLKALTINLGLFPHISFDRSVAYGGEIEVNEWDDDSLFELMEDWVHSWPQMYKNLNHVTVPLSSMSWDAKHEDSVILKGKLENLLQRYRVEFKIY